ncbi:MAG TPA: MBL fold metallo-hydrolase [Candidatus Udaeobacter sp.]|nr:MBL fold metallo-hydrolase [Candidatus Udaeobacter sp.]
MIRIHVLGSAAGGGLPQWNCACVNCIAARAGKIEPQTQSSIAISAQSEAPHNSWLINASPDLLRQIERTSQLQPRTSSSRNSRIAGVLLTNADIDHALGVLLLREQDKPLIVYAADQTRAALTWLDNLLARFCGIEWRGISADFQPLDDELGFRAITLPHSVAFQMRSNKLKRTVLFAPSVGDLTGQLRDAVQDSDVVFFDGTFWSDDELAKVWTGARSAREMNHFPISDGSLDFLRQTGSGRKIYTHINNTNPILMPQSRERAQVEQIGIEIAHDRLEIVL